MAIERVALLRVTVVVGIASALIHWGHELRAQPSQPTATPAAGAPTGDPAAAAPAPLPPTDPSTAPPVAEPAAATAPAASTAAQPTVDCKQSEWCKKAGLCTFWGGKCVAGSHEDCAYSEGCRSRGLCVAQRGACVAGPCSLKENCREKGYCSWLDGKCQAGSVADCRQSRVCTEDGKCMLNTEHHNCSDGTRRRSTGAMIGGVVLVGVSGLAAIIGSVFMVAAEEYSCDSFICVGPDDEDYRTMGIVALVGGAVTMSVGIPLLVYGAPKVTDEDAVSAQIRWQPTVRVGPTGGSLRWQF